MKQIAFKDISGYEFMTARPITTEFEVYEDNAGGLYLCILNQGKCVRIFEGFEYQGDQSLMKALQSLAEDEAAYEMWDGDNALYEDGLGDLIADNDGIWISNLGAAGAKAFGIER